MCGHGVCGHSVCDHGLCGHVLFVVRDRLVELFLSTSLSPSGSV